MSYEFKNDPSFLPYGPFISKDYKSEAITRNDIIIAGVVFGLTLVNVIIAIWLGYGQTKASRSPLTSTYVYLIWIELLVSFLMAIECFLYLLKYIKPSFYFYFTILFWWCIQVQLLLQIIINRIRVIVLDRHKSKWIMIWTAVFVTAINISVFNIWIPARLQVNSTYVKINEIWDRMEKVIYLVIDAALNWYFLKTVQENLISNGLKKYNKLLRFNQRIIIVSLLMDVMIIAAMSIPNSFVYIQFHPLAYLVKLNIEMTMANLIKRIAISTSRRTGNASIVHHEFNSDHNSSSNPTSGSHHLSNLQSSSHAHPQGYRKRRRSSLIELQTNVFSGKEGKTVSFLPEGQIKKTEEIHVTSEPVDVEIERRDLETSIRGPGMGIGKKKSLDDVTEGSVKSEGQRGEGDSDDEVRLVKETRFPWGGRR